MTRQRLFQIIVIAGCIAGYVWLGYFTPRINFLQVITIYSGLFGLYILILKKHLFTSSFRTIIGIALMLRLTLILMTPNLSDDYFRFIWDGLITAHGHNPYAILPSELISSPVSIPGITSELYSQLNSPDYYSVYPPVCQYIFAFSAKLNGGNLLGNIITMRTFLLLAEAGSLVLLYKITEKLALPQHMVAVYAFNPLIIIELTGNLHFEAVMICFFLLAVYYLIDMRLSLSAISLAAAIGTKFIPAIFLPLLIKHLGQKMSWRYCLIVAGGVILLFLPFISGGSLANLTTGLSLFFQKFEFNASVFYVVRWIGYQIKGYDVIGIAGIALMITATTVIVLIAVRHKADTWGSLFPGMLFSVTAYYGLATTIHPWYLAALIMIAMFTRYRYPLVWSIMVIFSYATYRTLPYAEDLWLVALEYSVVWGWFAYEMLHERNQDRQLSMEANSW